MCAPHFSVPCNEPPVHPLHFSMQDKSRLSLGTIECKEKSAEFLK